MTRRFLRKYVGLAVLTVGALAFAPAACGVASIPYAHQVLAEEAAESETSEEKKETSEEKTTEEKKETSEEKTTEEKKETSEEKTTEEKKETSEEKATEQKKDTEATTETAGTSTQSTQSSGSVQTTQGTSSSETTQASDEKNEKKQAKKDTKKTKTKRELKSIENILVPEEESAESEDMSGTIIPVIYNDTRLEMQNQKEMLDGYIYFNQTDAAWNQNGYHIASAGCGPTSMAVVISTLTGEWVTPIDTTVWAYQHGYYSRAGSAHALIPALAAAYGLSCEGVGTQYDKIKEALTEGNPVVCLMGPGYFTRGGHFMVLIGIDDEDCVTVADVGSRKRSAYKYRLQDIINQSKSASAGGPFWVIYRPQEESGGLTVRDMMNQDLSSVFADTLYMNLNNDISTSGETAAGGTEDQIVEVVTPTDGADILSGTGLSLLQTETVVIKGEEAEENNITKDRDLMQRISRDIADRQWSGILGEIDAELVRDGRLRDDLSSCRETGE